MPNDGVGADNGQDLAFLNLKANVPYRLDIAVETVELIDLQHSLLARFLGVSAFRQAGHHDVVEHAELGQRLDHLEGAVQAPIDAAPSLAVCRAFSQRQIVHPQ